MTASWFNDDQRAWMRYLTTLPREEKCPCGWNRRGECNDAECIEAEKRRPPRFEAPRPGSECP